MIRRLLAATALVLLFSQQAFAGAGTITVLDSTGTTQTYDVITDGSGNFVGKTGLCDQSAAANCAGVDSGHSLQVAGEGTAGSAAGGVVTVQGVASGTNLNVAQGTAANLNATVVGTGTFATQSAITAASGSIASGAIASGAIASGAIASGAIVDGGDVTLGTKADAAYTSGSGSAISVLKGIYTNTAAAVPAGTNVIGFVSNDPCAQAVKLNAAIGTSGATNVQVVAGVSAKKVYICSISLIVGSAVVANVIEGTGSSCTSTNEAAVIGSTTAANGMSLAANGGFTLGSGNSTVGVTATAANGICVLTGSSVAFGGNMTYVQQ